MARIILASELGGGLGHVTKLGAIGRALVHQGHELVFAVQRPDALRAVRDVAETASVRQAPVWPGSLTLTRDLPLLPSQGSYGDILAAMGLADSGVLEYLLRAWSGLLDDLAPDLLIAEFAPASLLAASGRIPRIAVGTGFSVPPADGRGFPAFDPDGAPVVAEATLLNVVNHALVRLGRAPLDRLAAIAAAEAHCPCVFTELDPYRGYRGDAVLAPMLSGPVGRAGDGDALFVYHNGQTGPSGQLLVAALDVLARRGREVVAYMPGLAGAERDVLRRAGATILDAPQPPDRIAAVSRLMVTAGGIGLVSSALAAGLPLVLLPHDREKRLTARAVAALDLGLSIGPHDPAMGGAELLAEAIGNAMEDDLLRERCRSSAPGFTARLASDPVAEITNLAQRLIGR